MLTVKSIEFVIADLNDRLMSTNDFDAVYFKFLLTYTDVIRICYKIGIIPGEMEIKEILGLNLMIIKRCNA
jgi:hypothetical protein